MTPIERSPWELRAVWAQAARVEAMRAARRAAEAEADDEATDDEAEAGARRRAAEEDELLLAGLHLSPPRRLSPGCCSCSRQVLLSAERDRKPVSR